MTNELEPELFRKWLMATERTEYINLTIQLFPEVDREQAEKMADELGYRETSKQNKRSAK